MRAGSLKTAVAVANSHGQGIVVIIDGIEWSLTSLAVVDRPEDLAICYGYTARGDLVVFDADAVDLVRIPAGPDGRRASIPKYRGGD